MAATTIRTTGKVLKYTLLPGFLPRLHAFFTSGFVHVAYTMALVYQSVRLLPPNHPYLDPANMGRFGIRHVIAEAANNLVLDRRNLDQIVIFSTILVAMALLFLQIVLLITAVIAQPVFAGAPLPPPVSYTYTNILGVNSIYGHGATGGPAQDIAFIILDRVFGMNGTAPGILFGSCISDRVAGTCLDLNRNPIDDPGGAYPFPFHIALHTLLRFYSMGIFFVAVIVILYFVTTAVGETAVTGSPFGQRFNKTWAPVRLILFFALLVPLNTGNANDGINGAQMLTFWSAKLGSNFATNAWGRFNQVLTGSYLGQANTLIATPNSPEINSLVRFMFVAKTCQIAEGYAYGDTDHAPNGIQGYIVRDALTGATGGTPAGAPHALPLNPTNFAQALAFVNNGFIEIRFGVRNQARYPLEKGNVKAFCGSLVVPITALDTPAPGFSGAYGMQEVYYDMVKAMWGNNGIVVNSACIRDRIMQMEHNPNCAAWPETNFANNTIDTWTNWLNTRIPAQIAAQVANGDFAVSPGLRATGWAGAAIWYNRIAQLNGEMSTAIATVPYGEKYPFVMEFIAVQNKAQNQSVNPEDLYDPALGGGREADYPRYKDRLLAASLYNAYMFWANTQTAATKQTAPSGNAFIDTINLIFGTHGVFSMRENTNIHPLAQLSALGKGMMDASVRNIAMGLAGSGLSGLMKSVIGNELSGLGKAFSSFALTMGKATMVMSFILYYVLPFLPFIYFMFAVSGWVKSIFEAIVAMPLWALAHITRMDGQGIAGPGANNGYFLILEIFLRPILILFGMVASISVFSASVRVLNEVFDLVVQNVSGFDMAAENTKVGPTKIEFYRQPIDRFFFSALYVIMVYMMATGFFKLIDQIPNNILRWLGVSVSTFSEAAGDPASQLTGKVYQGGTLAMGQIKSGGQLAALLGGSAPGPSDRRLKEAIVHLGQENGHNIYSFKYIGEDRTYIGVMADEVLRTHPEAVTVMDNGYLAVYYDRIGVRFREAH